MLWLVSILAARPAGAAPKISAPTTRLEIGEVIAGDTAEVEFPLENVGTETLTITQVTTSCGCTTASYPATLKPGEKGVLKARLAANALWAAGPVEKQIQVHSNDPDQPVLNLQLTAQIRPLLRFMPASPVTISYKKGDVLRQVVTVTSAVDPPIRITGVTPGGPGVEARLLPAEKSDKPGLARVEVTVHPPDYGGDFITVVNLQTTHPKVPTFPLVLHAISTQGITVSPPKLYLTALGAGENTGSPVFFVLSKRSGSFHVLSVKADAPELQAQLGSTLGGQAAQTNNLYLIDVHYRGGWPNGKKTGKIVVTTDDPEVPKIEVPYEATIGAAPAPVPVGAPMPVGGGQ